MRFLLPSIEIPTLLQPLRTNATSSLSTSTAGEFGLDLFSDAKWAFYILLNLFFNV